MMKKRCLISIFTILVAVSFIVGLAACGESETLDIKKAGPSEGLTFYEYDDHCVVTDIGTCTDENLVIPSEHNDLPVTAIDDGAFYYSKSFTSITIPDSVTYIGDDAFYYCTYLKDVEMGDNIEYIGHRAFYYCKALESVTIPDSVTTIGNSAFESCTSLESIDIPGNVTSMGEKAFADCTSLKDVYYNTSLLEGESVADCFENAGEAGFTLTIGTAVTETPENFFSSCSSLTEVKFEDEKTCESLGKYSFAYCDSLKKVTLPKSLVSIGNYSFYECGFLEEIFMDSEELDDMSSADRVFYKAGQKGEGITVTVSAGVTRIPAYMFCPYGVDGSSVAPKITVLFFENDSQCTTIASESFCYCASLVSINLPDCLTTIGSYSFGYCTSLTDFVIPDGVTTIGASAFIDCTSLTYFVVPDSLTSVGAYAFNNCSSIEDVYISDLVKWCSIDFANYTANPIYYATSLYLNGELVTDLVVPDEITVVDSYLFYDCTSLTSVTIPDGVTSVGERAFYKCSHIATLTIGAGVETIGNYAFAYCNALEEIYFNAVAMADLSSSNYVFDHAGSSGNGMVMTVGAGVTRIPAYMFYPYDAFSYVRGIENVLFEEGSICESIGRYAFYFCTYLTSIVIPKSVTTIGTYAFAFCYDLVDVYYGGDEDDWDTISMGSGNSSLTAATRYYYTEEEPSEDGSFWHYVDGEIVIWKKED